MLDQFRNLSDKGKLTVIAIAIAVFVGAIVLLGIFIGNKEPQDVTPVETNLPYSSPSASPSATASATASPSATATPTPTSVPSPGSDIVYGQTTLSVEDQQAAQTVAQEGIVSYFQSGKGETLETANARLSSYFLPESGVFGEGSLNNYFNMAKTDADNYITSEGVIDFIDPVGGNENLYKVMAGITYRVQFNRANEMPQVLEKNDSFTMLLSKNSGSWKIVSLEDSGS